MSIHSTDPSPMRVQVGIDAAVVANHHVCVREALCDGQVRLARFVTPLTLAGLRRLGVTAWAPTQGWWPSPSRPR